MIRLAMCFPDKHESGQYWRASLPYSELKKQIPGLYVETVDELTHWTICKYDAFFFFRPFGAGCLAMINMCKNQGKPVIADYDDLLFEVPELNASHSTYGKESTKDSIAAIIKIVDAVTVSTQFLKNKLQHLSDNIIVVPNAITDMVWDKRIKQNLGKKVITWRGGPSHDCDILHYVNQMVKFTEKHPDFIWGLFGGEYYKYWTTRLPKKSHVLFPLNDLYMYLDSIRDSKAVMHVVPLLESDFNKCKSNISWIEGTLSGACCIAPNWSEWQEEGIIRYDTKDPINMITAMEAVIKRPEMAVIANEQSQKTIEEKYLLSRVNNLRREVLMNVLEGRKAKPKLTPIPEEYEHIEAPH